MKLLKAFWKRLTSPSKAAVGVVLFMGFAGGLLFWGAFNTGMEAVCEEKIAKKGENVGLSFYAFFKNKNDNPKVLMEVATWWIQTHQLNHFEKAIKIKQMIQNNE